MCVCCVALLNDFHNNSRCVAGGEWKTPTGIKHTQRQRGKISGKILSFEFSFSFFFLLDFLILLNDGLARITVYYTIVIIVMATLDGTFSKRFSYFIFLYLNYKAGKM